MVDIPVNEEISQTTSLPHKDIVEFDPVVGNGETILQELAESDVKDSVVEGETAQDDFTDASDQLEVAREAVKNAQRLSTSDLGFDLISQREKIAVKKQHKRASADVPEDSRTQKILNRLRSKFSRNKEQVQTETNEGISEEKIAQLEKEMGLDSESRRVIEASLLVDKKFLDAALITGEPSRPERMFGDVEWAEWLEARLETKKHGGAKLDVGFIVKLHEKLTQHSNPQIAGIIRDLSMTGGDYANMGQAIEFTDEQRQSITSNPYLSLEPSPSEPEKALIVYPHAGENPAVLETLSERAKGYYTEYGPSMDALSTALLYDVTDWYNSTKSEGNYDSYQLAAELQRRIVSVHGFNDANGRLSRVLMDWSLNSDGLPPAILDDPTDDILVTPAEWTKQVKNGSERYSRILEQRQKMEKAGVKDVADLMGVDEQRTFYQYIYKRIKEAPSAPEGQSILSHAEHDSFWEGFNAELDTFRTNWSTDSVVEDPYGKTIAVHQGGLAPEAYIRLIDLPSNPHLDEYIREKFFTRDKLYRGGVCEDSFEERDILTLFRDYTGITSSYLAGRMAGVSETSAKPVSKKDIQKSIDDPAGYNKNIGSSYIDLKAHPGLAPFNGLTNLASNHFGNMYKHSPLISTSFDNLIAERFSTGNMAAGTMKQSAEQGIQIKSGFSLEMDMPRFGLLGYGTKTTDRRHDIPIMTSLTNIVAEEKEFAVIGGIDPRSIRSVTIYDQVGEVDRLTGEPTLKAQRLMENGKEIIVVTNYRDQANVKETKYALDSRTGGYKAVI